jgi:hypothetical protein
VNKIKAIIDADVLVYQTGFSAQKTSYRFVYANGRKIEYDDLTIGEVKKELVKQGLCTNHGKLQKLIHPIPVEYALQRAKMLIESILDKVNADTFKAFLTANDKSNYRFKVATMQEYKGNRKNSKRPVHYDVIREYLMTHYDAEVTYDQEADDAMGIEQMRSDGNSIICSIDKDLDMIPGHHYNLNSEESYIATDPGEIFLDDNRSALHGRGLKWFYAQMLLGDTADNIPGIKGYGPVAVYNALGKARVENEYINITKEVYQKNYKNTFEKAYREVANLLWIRRYPGEFKGDVIC